MQAKDYYDAIIIGAGAAGAMCAIEAAKNNAKILLLDHSNKVGEKIRISGGGRCNFTNLDIQPHCYLSQNPRFCLSALRRYTQYDFIDLVKSHKIKFHEKTLGQLFCDDSAKQIIKMLTDEMDKKAVHLALGINVDKVSYDNDCYVIKTDNGVYISPNLVIATGGKSIPKMGATSFGYKIAEQFNINLIETRPALVPLTFTEDDLADFAPLSGISVQSKVSYKKTSFEEGLLFTHRGLSGPSVLQISSYWKEGEAIEINLATEINIEDELLKLRNTNGKLNLDNALAKLLPNKLAKLIIKKAGLSGNLADQSNLKIKSIASLIHECVLQPIGTEGYRTAEVTLGGVDTKALNAKTMEAKKQPGLYFIGEVVDVTGWLGGYNFQWAWSSGWACGQALSSNL